MSNRFRKLKWLISTSKNHPLDHDHMCACLCMVLHGSTCISQHPKLRTGGLVEAKFYCRQVLLADSNAAYTVQTCKKYRLMNSFSWFVMTSPEIFGRSFMNDWSEAGGNGCRGASDMLSCSLLPVVFSMFLKSDTYTSEHGNHFQPLYRSTCVSYHPQLRTGGFCRSKILLPACPCWWQLLHSD